MNKKLLTPKQQAFVDEYLKDLNGKQAAIRCGYSVKTAESQASRLLSNAKVKAAVQEAMDARSKRTNIDADRVLTEIAKLAFADIRKVFDSEGRLLPIQDLPDEIAASISSIEVVTTRIPGGEPTDVEHTSKIKFWDKRGSLELLGRNLKLFTDKIELNDGKPLIVEIVRFGRGKDQAAI